MRRRLPCQPHHSHHRLTYQAHPGVSLCSGDSLAIHDLSWDCWIDLGPSSSTHIDMMLRGKSGFWYDPNKMYRTHTGCHIAMCLTCMENAKKAIRLKLHKDVCDASYDVCADTQNKLMIMSCWPPSWKPRARCLPNPIHSPEPTWRLPVLWSLPCQPNLIHSPEPTRRLPV